MRTFRSNGEDQARVYVELNVLPTSVDPTLEMETVHIADPHQTPTLQSAERSKGSGPRNPEQRLAKPQAPDVELPDGLPLMEAQLVIVPPELVAQWREEARKKKGEAP